MECDRKSVADGGTAYPLEYLFKKGLGLVTKWGFPTKKAKAKKGVWDRGSSSQSRPKGEPDVAQLRMVGAGQLKSSKRKIHPAPPILKHSAKAAGACKIIQSASSSAPNFIPQSLEADEEEATGVMPTADLVAEVRWYGSMQEKFPETKSRV